VLNATKTFPEDPKNGKYNSSVGVIKETGVNETGRNLLPKNPGEGRGGEITTFMY